MDNSKTVFRSLENAVQAAFGESAVILRSDSIPGGDINDAYRVTLSGGQKIFVKANRVRNLNFFLTEAEGLEALGATRKIKVPEVLGYGIDERRGCSFLAMEYIESAPRTEAYWERFGHQLAELHRALSERAGVPIPAPRRSVERKYDVRTRRQRVDYRSGCLCRGF